MDDGRVDMVKDTRACLLCGGTPLTNAHIISKALRTLLPHDSQGTRWLSWDSESTDESVDVVRLQHRTFDRSMFDMTVKRLCESCNRDWMGEIERNVNGILASMATDTPVRLTQDLGRQLATWASLATMLRGTLEPKPWGFTETAARKLRQQGSSPEEWVVLLGRAEFTRTDIRARHLRFTVEVDGQAYPQHVSYFYFGQLIVLVGSESARLWLMPRLSSHQWTADLVTLEGDAHWPPVFDVALPELDELVSAALGPGDGGI